MHIQVNNRQNAKFSVTVAGADAMALYDTDTFMSHVTFTCYTNLKNTHLCEIYKHFPCTEQQDMN